MEQADVFQACLARLQEHVFRLTQRQVRACGRQVDPLVEVSVRDGRSLKTKQVKNNANPEFDEVMNFIVDDPDTQTITAFLREADFAFSKARAVPPWKG